MIWNTHNENTYKHNVVRNIQDYYAETLDHRPHEKIKDHLLLISEKMYEGILQKLPFLYSQLNNYHPSYIGQSIEELRTQNITQLDCKECIANEYGFSSWEQVNILNPSYNHGFENAVNALLIGDFEALFLMLKNDNEIINTKSDYGHEASLINYVASNGVEMWRQQVPKKLIELTTLIISFNPEDSKMKVYGGHFSTYDLLVTSAHPKEAGILEELKILLSEWRNT